MLVAPAVERNDGSWSDAIGMTTSTVWEIILKDCIIPKQGVWMARIHEKLSNGQATEEQLELFAKAIDAYNFSVRDLRFASPGTTGIHCEIWTVINRDWRRLIGCMQVFAWQSKGRLLGEEVTTDLIGVLEETVEDLHSLLSEFSEQNFALTVAREPDSGSITTSTDASTVNVSLLETPVSIALQGTPASSVVYSSRSYRTTAEMAAGLGRLVNKPTRSVAKQTDPSEAISGDLRNIRSSESPPVLSVASETSSLGGSELKGDENLIANRRRLLSSSPREDGSVVDIFAQQLTAALDDLPPHTSDGSVSSFCGTASVGSSRPVSVFDGSNGSGRSSISSIDPTDFKDFKDGLWRNACNDTPPNDPWGL
jgi:hypothetical protein